MTNPLQAEYRIKCASPNQKHPVAFIMWFNIQVLLLITEFSLSDPKEMKAKY